MNPGRKDERNRLDERLYKKMKIKMTLSKAEKILALLNQWDPAGEHKRSGDWRAYRFEAETIAQRVRSNSSAASIEKAIREAMEYVMHGETLDDNEVHQMALYIQYALKK